MPFNVINPFAENLPVIYDLAIVPIEKSYHDVHMKGTNG